MALRAGPRNNASRSVWSPEPTRVQDRLVHGFVEALRRRIGAACRPVEKAAHGGEIGAGGEPWARLVGAEHLCRFQFNPA